MLNPITSHYIAMCQQQERDVKAEDLYRYYEQFVQFNPDAAFDRDDRVWLYERGIKL